MQIASWLTRPDELSFRSACCWALKVVASRWQRRHHHPSSLSLFVPSFQSIGHQALRKMEDSIACLYPIEKFSKAWDVVTNDRNSSRKVNPQEESAQPSGPGDEGSTSDDEANSLSHLLGPGLQLTFSQPPKASQGFVFGNDAAKCDIFVPIVGNVSRHHFYIAFDAQRRLIVRDSSSAGLIVTYNGDGGERRRRFKWVIGGDEVSDRIENIVIEISKALKFQIVVSRPTSTDAFAARVDHFCRENAQNSEVPLGALGLQSAVRTVTVTRAPSAGKCEGASTPNKRSILLCQRRLGKGSFSVVDLVWDVSTGLKYASKIYNHADGVDWQKEASLVHKISHVSVRTHCCGPDDLTLYYDHIVRFVAVIETPSPRLILEYLPLGNLTDQHGRQSITRDESVIILRQGLSAITYLHGREPPITHRDIKPENILVKSRHPLHIKLADFGLSKESDCMSTICGTHTYLTPEVIHHSERIDSGPAAYTQAVDIWSLGVVVFQYAYGLPSPGRGWGRRWCLSICEALKDCSRDDFVDLLSVMVVSDTTLRASGHDCLEKALEIAVSLANDSPTRASASQSPHPPACNVKLEERATVVGHPIEDRRIARQIDSSLDDGKQASIVDPAVEDCTHSLQGDSAGSSEVQEAHFGSRPQAENQAAENDHPVEDLEGRRQKDLHDVVESSAQSSIRPVALLSTQGDAVQKRKRSTSSSMRSPESSERPEKKSARES
jgi:serine/threonine protein kinase